MSNEQKDAKKGKPKGKLPNIVLDLATIVSHRTQDGQPAGPMTAVALLGKRAKQVLELAPDGELPEKFLGVKALEEFAERVLKDFEDTWQLLEAIDKGNLATVPDQALKDNPEPGTEGQTDDDHPDGDGTDEADPASRPGGSETGD